jgi:hypothetical protein
MTHRIILVRNGEYKKTLHKCKTVESSIENFEKIIQENSKVNFPQKFITTKKVQPVEYKIYRVKDIEEGDEIRLVRDKFGKLYEEKPLYGIWTVLDESDYQVEESFYVYGFDPVHDRKDINFIINLLYQEVEDQQMSKSIVVLHNKVFIYNEDFFDFVLCKCKQDAKRLYNVLFNSAKSRNFKRLIFLGEAGEMLTGELYEIMMEETGWNYRRVTRTSTTT